MSTMHTEERIGEAWRLTLNGELDAALKIYNEILQRTEENVDAHYGKALVLRKQGDNDGSIKEFQIAYKLSKSAYSAVRVTSVVDGHTDRKSVV